MQTITRYRSGHLPKISDKAMLYLLSGFVTWPFYAVWYTIKLFPKYRLGALGVWSYMYARQMQVWNWI